MSLTSVSYRATDFAASRALDSSAPASVSASQISLFIVLMRDSVRELGIRWNGSLPQQDVTMRRIALVFSGFLSPVIGVSERPEMSRSADSGSLTLAGRRYTPGSRRCDRALRRGKAYRRCSGRCRAHVAKAGPKRIAQLCKIEDKIRGEAPATRRFGRWTESAPLVNAFGIWLDEQRSRLGEKLTHIANQWEGLVVFLYDGRVEMDSNFVENRIRPLKLTAKNGLFAGHDEGARSWGRVGSLIETCKMNGVEPYAWLKSTLEKIAAGHPQSRIHQLLPWNFDPTAS